MALVDTSVWVRHLREGDAHLEALLEDDEVCCHPFIVGELACGHIKNRQTVLSLLHALPMLPVASHEEVLHSIEANELMGSGLGLVDVHLLASARLSAVELWTLDKSLWRAAGRLGIGYCLP